MDQLKIGSFIKERRKSKNMTQKELGDIIGVSDKTISKWENGNSMPDISLFDELCHSLDINVNELISGEILPPDDYSIKAEANLMELLNEKKATGKQTVILSILGGLLVIGGLLMLFINLFGYASIQWTSIYVDGISFFIILLFL